MMVLAVIYLACLLLSAVTGFIYLPQLRSRRLSAFPFYLSLLFLQELTLQGILHFHDRSFSTGIVYNIYTPVNTTFYALFYYSVPFNRPFRGLILTMVVAFLLLTAATYVFFWNVQVYNSHLSLVEGFIITLCGLFFLFNYFKLDNHAEEKKWLPVVWITIGMVAFYPIANITFALYKYLLSNQLRLYRVIPQLMSIFMYVCFIRAFYLCSKTK